MSNEISRLEKRIEELKEAKSKLDTLRKLESYSDKEKCIEFDKFYYYAREIIEEKVSKGYIDEDTGHWCFEMVMNLLGEDIWECFNTFER